MARRKRRIVIRDRRKTALRIAAVLLGLIALAGIAVLAFFTVKSCGVNLVTRTVPIWSSETLCGTGDGIMTVRAGMLEFLSYRDEDYNFSKPLSGVPTGLAGTAGVKAVYTKETVQIVDAPFDIVAEGEIRAVRCGSEHAAVCTRRPNGSECVSVYNSTGQPIYTLEYEAGRLVNFGFSEASGTTLWTMELDTDSGTPRTTVTTFDLGRMSSTGVITVSGQLIEDVFFTSSSVFLVGTESLIRCSASANREIYRVQLYGYRVIDRSMNGESPVLLLVPRGQESLEGASSVRLLTVSQKDVAEESSSVVMLPAGVIDCHLANGSLIVTRANSVTLYSVKGKAEETEPLPEGVTVASIKLDEHHILLERSGEFVLLTVGK
ncbi:MAG: hypothetical protein J5772_08435 [Clostridia bacterium]|nr:hypothetical protein [Clostridia bacterium]